MTSATAEAMKVTQLECLAPRLSGNALELGYVARSAAATVHRFTEVVELPGGLAHVPPAQLDRVLRLLSLAASLSYFKAFAPATIAVPDGLTVIERRFLSGLTRHGMGEFAFVNGLPEVLDTTILAPGLAGSDEPAPEPGDPRRALVAVGGGKDSIVSIEALRVAGLEVGLFSVNSYAPIAGTASVAGFPLVSAHRRLDPQLFRLNDAGAPNGHVPVTAVNSILAVLTAMALGYDTVVFSNEASSSFGNVSWQGQTINHQWSKGIEFERSLRDSLPEGAPQYLSLLRPLTELRIARRFAQHERYHGVFTSCNRAFRLQRAERTSWCTDCPKCRFVFLMLGPFLSRAALLQIFGGQDMFADDRQLAGFLELLGARGTKPFECVGEPDECRVALDLLREHPEWRDHPFLTRSELADVDATPAEREAAFAFREDEHLLPPRLEAIAREI